MGPGDQSETGATRAPSRQLSVRGVVIILCTTFILGLSLSALVSTLGDRMPGKGRSGSVALNVPPPKPQDEKSSLEAFKMVDLQLFNDCLHLRAAAQHMFKMDYEKALEELSLVSDAYRRRDQSWYSLEVECLLSTKQIDKVIILANGYVAEHPNQYAGYMWRAQAFEQEKNYPAAIKDFKKALDVFQEEKPNMASRLHTSAGFARSVIDAIDSILHKHLGTSLERNSDYKAAAEEYQKALLILSDKTLSPTINVPIEPASTAQRSISSVNKALEGHPREASLYAERADLYKTVGKFDLSIKDYDQASKLTPASRFHLQYERAGAYWGLKDYKNTCRDLRKVFHEDPLYEQPQERQRKYAFLIMPAIYMSKSEALSRFDEAISKQPNVAINYYYRGVIELAFNDFDLSGKDLAHFLDMHAQNDDLGAKAHIYLALCRVLDGRHAESEIILKKIGNEYAHCPWWHALAAYLNGSADEAGIMDAAGQSKARIAQCQYVIGQKFRSDGKKRIAEQHFQKGVSDGAPVVDEFYLCQMALLPELEEKSEHHF